jgi:hypothetical protein
MKPTVIVLLAAFVAGCASPSLLDNTQPTAEALAREVLLALQRRDEPRLQALALTEGEFEERVWPGLPAARPERNLPWSYVWMDLRQKSQTMLARTLREHGGRVYALEQVKFEGSRTDHGNYQVHRDTVLVVRNSDGERVELRVMGSMIESREGWKVFSYMVDE